MKKNARVGSVIARLQMVCFVWLRLVNVAKIMVVSRKKRKKRKKKKRKKKKKCCFKFNASCLL